MEKIKLSSYSKKQGKINESTGNNFYETDPLMVTTDNKMGKYIIFNFRQTKKNSEQI